MKIIKYFSCVLLLFLNSCTHQKQQLANNYYKQSLLELEDRNIKDALQLINQAVILNPIPQYLAFKANILYQLNAFQESLTLLEKIIKQKNISPHFKADLMNNYACLLNKSHQGAKAREIWLKLTKNVDYIAPEVAFYNLGLQCLNENLEQARQYFMRAIQITPTYVDAIFFLCVVEAHLGHRDKAKKYLNKLLQITPEHRAAKRLLYQLK